MLSRVNIRPPIIIDSQQAPQRLRKPAMLTVQASQPPPVQKKPTTSAPVASAQYFTPRLMYAENQSAKAASYEAVARINSSNIGANVGAELLPKIDFYV